MHDMDLPLLADPDTSEGSSTDWDEVNEFCRRVYMPYRVSTSGRATGALVLLWGMVIPSAP